MFCAHSLLGRRKRSRNRCVPGRAGPSANKLLPLSSPVEEIIPHLCQEKCLLKLVHEQIRQALQSNHIHEWTRAALRRIERKEVRPENLRVDELRDLLRSNEEKEMRKDMITENTKGEYFRLRRSTQTVCGQTRYDEGQSDWNIGAGKRANMMCVDHCDTAR